MIDIKDETFGGSFPFAPHYYPVNGFDMHYVDEGKGEPVVIMLLLTDDYFYVTGDSSLRSE